MLVEMWSPVFKKNDVIRGPIRFNKGLNVIMGMDHADNSIGKSSALLAIDFVFGGKTYLNSIAVKQLGHHKIYFCFKFDKEYFFLRNTESPDEIIVCNSDYEPTNNKFSLKEFLNRLKYRYGIVSPDLPFRLVTSGFFRIAGKNNQDTDYPLRVFNSQKQADSITTLIQLFNEYDNVALYKNKLENAKEQLNTFKKARKYEFISNLVGGKKQFENNLQEIEKLEYKLTNLREIHRDDLKSDDILKNHQRIELRNSKLEYEKQLNDLHRRQKLLDISLEFGLYPTESDLTELQSYFPDTNIKKLYEVEQYHKKLAEILDSTFIKESKKLKVQIDGLNEQIQRINTEISNLGEIPTLSNEFLDAYSELTSTINALKTQNDVFLKEKELQKEKTNANLNLERSVQDVLADIQSQLNSKMREFNNIIYPDIRKSPLITLNSHNSYSFHTPNDDGTGTKYKGLILLDLAILQLTSLPAIVHDSLLLKNVGDKPVEGILELYVQSKNLNKQVFLAFDKAKSYSENVYNILTEHTVLTLSDNGNELYGISWNKGKNPDEE